MMIQGKWYPTGAEISQPLAIRESVLGRGRDALDDLAQQVTVLRDGVAVGAARLWWADGAFWAGDVCVLREERGHGFGDLLVRLLLFKAVSHGAGVVALTATPETAPFFAKYGFASVPGQEGEMRLRGEDVRLSHCAGCEDAASCAGKAQT